MDVELPEPTAISTEGQPMWRLPSNPDFGVVLGHGQIGLRAPRLCDETLAREFALAVLAAVEHLTAKA